MERAHGRAQRDTRSKIHPLSYQQKTTYFTNSICACVCVCCVCVLCVFVCVCVSHGTRTHICRTMKASLKLNFRKFDLKRVRGNSFNAFQPLGDCNNWNCFLHLIGCLCVNQVSHWPLLTKLTSIACGFFFW